MPVLVVGILLFDAYETLDAHGPVELLGVPPTQEHFQLLTVAEHAGPVKSKQGLAVIADFGFDNCPQLDVLLVPGGLGTRRQISNAVLLSWLKDLYSGQQRPLKYLLSVCTGSGLLAKAGLLDGRRATSNKLAWEWVTAQSQQTEWVKQARWVADGNIITSAGVSAGMDMILYFVAQLLGNDVAAEAAKYAEYNGQWSDSSKDPWGARI